jgi:hypothetical protein
MNKDVVSLGTWKKDGAERKREAGPTKASRRSSHFQLDRKPRLLTLGGCNVLEVALALTDYCDFDHVWRFGVFSLFAKDNQLTQRLPDEFIENGRNRIKRFYQNGITSDLKKIEHDYIVVDMAQHFLYSYVHFKGCFYPDLFSPFWFDQPIQDLVPEDRRGMLRYMPEGATLIDWTDPRFQQAVIHHAVRTFEALKKRARNKDVKIFLYCPVLARQQINEDGTILSLVDVETLRLQEWIDTTSARIVAACGFILLRSDPRLAVTSFDAPWGPFIHHPIREQYLSLAERLIGTDRPAVAGELLSRNIVADRQGRIAALAAANAALREREATIADLQLRIETDLRERSEERDRMAAGEGERQALLAQHDDLSRVLAERDQSLQEIQILLSARETALQDAQAIIAERDATCRAAAERDAERDAELLQLTDQIEDIKVQALDRDIALLDARQQIETLQAAIASLEAQLAEAKLRLTEESSQGFFARMRRRTAP